MKHNVTQLEGKNEHVDFSSLVLGNYFLEVELGNYQAEEVSCESDTQSNILPFSWKDNSRFNPWKSFFPNWFGIFTLWE